MFGEFLKVFVFLAVLACVASFMASGPSKIIPIIVCAGVAWAVFHVAKGLGGG